MLRPLRRRVGAGGETTLDRLVREDATGRADEPSLAASTRFVGELGRALLSLGLPAQRLEEALERVGEVLDCEVDAFSTLVPEAVVPEPVAAAPGRRRSQAADPEPPPAAGAPETETEEPEGTGFLRDLDY